VSFLGPVGAGDTVTARLAVIALDRREGRPGGRVTVDDEVYDQDGRVVLRFRRVLLVRLRGERAPKA
jgi:acyl dehydratase